jgi:hypothetical protein
MHCMIFELANSYKYGISCSPRSELVRVEAPYTKSTVRVAASGGTAENETLAT